MDADIVFKDSNYLRNGSKRLKMDNMILDENASPNTIRNPVGDE